MEIAEGKGQEFAKRPRVVDNTQHAAYGTMPAEAASAPFALAARQVDLAGDADAQPLRVFTGDDFAHELVSGCSGESIVTALQFEVSGADSCGEHSNTSETQGDTGQGSVTNIDALRLEVNLKHCFKRLCRQA